MEYRDRGGITTIQEPETSTGADNAAKEDLFGIDDLAKQYGLEDLMDFSDGTAQPDQSIEDEFNAYITAPLSPKGTDVLKFWEVSDLIIITLIILLILQLSAQ